MQSIVVREKKLPLVLSWCEHGADNVLCIGFIRRGFYWGDTTPMRPEPNHIRY